LSTDSDIFAHWAILLFGQSVENYRRRPTFWPTFFRRLVFISILAKMAWPTFWAIFSQTHLVTLQR
jgi:hypothetical protein